MGVECSGTEAGKNDSARGKPREDKKLNKVKGGEDEQVKIRTGLS